VSFWTLHGLRIIFFFCSLFFFFFLQISLQALCVLLLAPFVSCWNPVDVFVEETINATALKDELVEMFYHGYTSYKETAGFDHDELKPLSCGGHNKMGGLSTTLVDSLDMLAILGDAESFTEGVDWVLANLTFDKDANVSVFETNIRILGGLLAAHLVAMNETLNIYQGEYHSGLLDLSVDLADRLLVAFDTPTGLPYGTVNLKHGVPIGESKIVCAACCATFSLEFGMLSILTGNPVYADVAKVAAERLWSRRSKNNLLSTHLDVDNGKWMIQTTCGLGGDIDSAFEYFFKAGDAFDDERYKEMFIKSYETIEASFRLEGEDFLHYVDADYVTGVKKLNVRSLSAFWPGILAQIGEIESANRTIHSFFEIVKMYGYLPESVCVTSLPYGPKAVSDLSPEPFHRGTSIDGYPLRPELIESVYHLYGKTRDPSLLKIALRTQQGLRKTRVPCGFCSVHGVIARRHNLLDQMDSFVLSETFKYLYLLWDLAENTTQKNWVNEEDYVFTTEAHVFPMSVLKQKMQHKLDDEL
jgi:mannosidase alpha-like ER degradation enhancer 2